VSPRLERIQIRIDFGRLDPDPEVEKWPTKIKKGEEISCFKDLKKKIEFFSTLKFDNFR
jgi:hypothetical protein